MKLVVAIAVGLRQKDVSALPSLQALRDGGSSSSIAPTLPAVTTSIQATYLTGETPAQHGIVGNGWYHRDTREIRFWLQSRSLVEKPTLIDRLQKDGFNVANLFWWYNMGSGARWSLTPRPEYPADGRKIPSVYGEPAELPVKMQQELGTFPLFDFWGPRAGITSTRWIVDSALKIASDEDPDLLLVYLPHLDYDDQRYGPDSSQAEQSRLELDRELHRLLEGCRGKGAEAMVLSEYGIEAVDRPIFPNRCLAEAGELDVQVTSHGDLLDVHRSRAFAVCDHQVAHVYVQQGSDVKRIRQLLSELEGVDRILEGDDLVKSGLNHRRSGEMVLIAEPGAWFAYPWWNDDRRAPDYARTVDIHRKPGYDPAELFVDPQLSFPALKIAGKVLARKLGFRNLLDVISTDPSQVSGSHGRPVENPEEGPVVVRSWETGIASLEATEIHNEIVERVRQSKGS
ncbi:MAG: alkaline phosphatase family protein [Planctomycetes bacterium]|nr:alkaline phosphatase family protein [Planctomycetota bacterium]